jgi:glucose-6-phosphate dehydrogenase assembly protein OpcA
MKALFDPAKIEKELRLLERELSQTETRTSLFNLIILECLKDEAEIEETLLSHLLGKRAARVIHISLDTPGDTRVSVSARCAPDRENKGVCFQEILIADGTDKAGTAPGSWSAFLIRDIPVYVLWRAPFSKKDTLVFAREQADKFIIDGEFTHARQGTNFEEYLRHVRKELLDERVPTADFAWERLRHLRAFTARVFDLPEAMTALPEVLELSLSGPGEVSLRLHALWIASCLDWKKEAHRFLSSGGAAIPLSIRPEADGTIRTVFRFKNSRTIEIVVDPHGYGTAKLDGKEILSKVLAFPHDGEILLQQVDMPGSDGLYEKAVGLN